MPSPEIITAIYARLGSNTVLLPLQFGTKKCLARGWQKTQIADTQTAAYSASLLVANVGVSLGAPSEGLISIDLDDDDVAAELLDKNPSLASTLRTRGVRGCNLWVRIDGDYPGSCKLFSKAQNKPVGEWRSTGNYTAIYGRHPTGCDYTWLVDAPAVTLKYSDIIWPDDVSVSEPSKSVVREVGKPLAETLLANRRKVAETQLHGVIWEDDVRGFCRCPGKERHTAGDGDRDCQVAVDGVPTVHCLHTSCMAEVVRANALLRQASLSNEVVILPDGYASVEDAAEQVYEILKGTRNFYLRGNTVSEIGSSTTTGPCLEPMTVIRAQATWEKYTRFGFRKFKDGEEKTTLCLLPELHAKLLLAADERKRLPFVEGVVTCPILFKDDTGALAIHSDGYNAQTKLYVSNATGATVPVVPLKEAIEAIRDLVGDFLFESPAHRSRAIMSFITPALVFSGLLGGRPPVDVAEADDSQAGKGYRHKMICAIYGETPAMVSQKKGGVGGLDESFQEALIRGRPFICLENLRGRLDSPLVEGFLTAPDTFGARGFGKAEIEVKVSRFVTLLSSNELSLTVDMANRSSIIRIQKQPQFFKFKQYGDGVQKVDVAEWIKLNQSYYLGCVYRVVQEWYSRGCPGREDHGDHDFRWWARRGDWFCQNLFGEAPMLVGHRSIQTRAGDARLSWLQRVAVQADKSGRLFEPLKMHELLNLCGEGGFEPYRKSGDANKQFGDDAAELRYLGTSFGPLFQRCANRVDLDGYSIVRDETTATRETNGQTFSVKGYTVLKAGVEPPAVSSSPNTHPVTETSSPASISFTSTLPKE